MDNILNIKTGTLTILLADPVTETATDKVLELINDLSNKNIPTLLYEFNTYETWHRLKEQKDKNSNIYVGHKSYLEDICHNTRNYKYLYDIKCLIIDDLTEISTKQSYCLGRGDIVSIIIQELKKLAQELNISIIATAPTNPTFYGLNNDKSKLLSFFCKAETAKDYVDKIIILENECKNNRIIKELAYDGAYKRYCDQLPIKVEERLNKELKSIIENDYATLYLIAQKIVEKANEDGYIMGFRGSVGSSLVAYCMRHNRN